MGFVQAGLDVEASAVCIAVLWFGLNGMLPRLLVVILYFYFFTGLQFRAGQTTMPCLHKALLVGSAGSSLIAVDSVSAINPHSPV